MTTDYQVKLQITLEPVGCPYITVVVGEQTFVEQLIKTTEFNFEFVANTRSKISVTHRDKLPNDPSTAVIIKQLSFFGIHDPKFAWAGEYRPQYPEPWYSLQSIKPKEVLASHPYLGWNGTWTLEFDVPVFTWIHQIQNHGWIYD